MAKNAEVGFMKLRGVPERSAADIVKLFPQAERGTTKQMREYSTSKE